MTKLGLHHPLFARTPRVGYLNDVLVYARATAAVHPAVTAMDLITHYYRRGHMHKHRRNGARTKRYLCAERRDNPRRHCRAVNLPARPTGRQSKRSGQIGR